MFFKTKNICKFFILFSLLGFLVPSVQVNSALPQNSLVGILKSAGAVEAHGIYDAASIAGAIKEETAFDKQKAFKIIDDAVKDFYSKNSGAVPGEDMYRHVEIALAKQGMLTYFVQIPKELPKVQEKPAVQQTKPVVQQAIVKTVLPTTLKDKFYTALSGVTPDSYKIFSALEGKQLLSSNAKENRKEIIKIIKLAIKKDQEQLKDTVTGPAVQQIYNGLQKAGFINK